MPSNVSESEIFGLFSSFGEVTTVKVDHTKRGNVFHWLVEAHVDFAFDEDAKDAVDNLHMAEIGGSVITCILMDNIQ